MGYERGANGGIPTNEFGGGGSAAPSRPTGSGAYDIHSRLVAWSTLDNLLMVTASWSSQLQGRIQAFATGERGGGGARCRPMLDHL